MNSEEIEKKANFLGAYAYELIVPNKIISFGRNWHLGLSRLPEGR
jgi:hypothetical protein